MSVNNEPIATLNSGDSKAEIFSCELPGEFTVRFLDGTGKLLEETSLTGVSTYRLRETEILAHLQSLVTPGPTPPADLSDAGEY